MNKPDSSPTRLRCLFVGISMFVLSLAARADSYSLFSLNASLDNGGSVTGTLNLDRTNPLDSTLDVIVSSAGTTFSFDGAANHTYQQPLLGLTFPVSTGRIELFLPSSSFTSYTGGIYTEDNPDGAVFSFFQSSLNSNFIGFTDATLTTATTVTPEPSSLALLSTGLLGLAGLVRRRFIS